MKFNDGYWLLREGVTARYATEALDLTATPESASLAVLTRRVEHRGSVLNAPTITVELTAPAPDVIAVRAGHFLPVGPPPVAFQLTRSPVEVRVEEEDAVLRLTAGRLAVEASTAGPWELRFLGDGAPLTGSGVKSLAAMSTDEGEFLVDRLSLPVGANVYG